MFDCTTSTKERMIRFSGMFCLRDQKAATGVDDGVMVVNIRTRIQRVFMFLGVRGGTSLLASVDLQSSVGREGRIGEY